MRYLLLENSVSLQAFRVHIEKSLTPHHCVTSSQPSEVTSQPGVAAISEVTKQLLTPASEPSDLNNGVSWYAVVEFNDAQRSAQGQLHRLAQDSGQQLALPVLGLARAGAD